MTTEQNQTDLRRYRGVVVRNGQQVFPTVYVDWFADDTAAIAGYRELMAEQGYNVVDVRIGEIVEVEIE